MPTDLIELARQKKAAAEETLRRLQEEVGHIQQDIAEWQAFIDRAESLTSGSMLPQKPASTDNGKVSVQRDSWAGLCAQAILSKGPQAVNDLVEQLKTTEKAKEVQDINATLNSAIWRRRYDLFERKENLIHLRTKEIDFTD